jgi:dienelactone hydrolase
MAGVSLFPNAQGLTSGVRDDAERRRRAGHLVHVPDLYEGQVFDDPEARMAYAQESGFASIIERGRFAAAGLPGGLVDAGFSLGVLPAQMLAQTRYGAKGALLLQACVPASELREVLPQGVPVQIHGMDADVIFVEEGDPDAARALVEAAANAERWLYPGGRHLFADDSLPSYDEGATRLLTERVLCFLEGVERRSR